MSANNSVKKTAVLFPGQGVTAPEICSYYKLLKNKNPQLVTEYMAKFQTSLDKIYPAEKFEVEKILEDEKSESFLKTVFIQPLIYTLSIITFKLANIKPDFVTGHSLGALSALTAAGVISYDSGIELVVYRGLFMQEASNEQPSGMIAVIGISFDKLNELAQKTGSVLALSNAPTAYVLGCTRDKFQPVQDEAVKAGAAKTIVLPNAGAFHTGFMRPAYEKFNEKLAGVNFQKAEITVVCNTTGSAFIDPDELKKDISDSMISPVNWIRMMEYLKGQGVDLYIESGPGSSLSILARMNGVEREKISHAKDKFV